MRYFFILLCLVPSAFAQSGGGGSSGPMTFTYEQCSTILQEDQAHLQEQIAYYKMMNEDYEQLISKLHRRMDIIDFVLLSIIVYSLLRIGMVIQKIDDKGFKNWWKNK